MWIAFNYLSLTFWQQPKIFFTGFLLSCELLSIIYLWHSDNNKMRRDFHLYLVVNCFQLFIFDILTTTLYVPIAERDKLWIAFNYLSLTFWQQQYEAKRLDIQSCELLSIIYLWHSDNNRKRDILYCRWVVNCFQLFIFDILTTTEAENTRLPIVLWIAFNYLSLTFWQQPLKLRRYIRPVVNCFQLFIFDILTTTSWKNRRIMWQLWIAFNYLSLTFWQQPGK